MKSVCSKVKLNMPKINQLSRAAIMALEKTTDALLTEVKQSQVMPFRTGNMQNDSTFPDYSESRQGKTGLITSTPYSRRMFFHPEYNFYKGENAYAKGEWYEDWISGKSKDFCKEAFASFYKKEADLE